MKAIPNFSNPPIKEAILQVKFNSAVKAAAEGMDAIAKKIEHSKINPIQQVTISHEKGKSPALKEALFGYQIVSKDTSYGYQLSSDSFTMSWTKSYPGWDRFLGTFIGAWKQIESDLKAQNIFRLSTRFINRIVLPTDIEHVDIFMPAFPKLSTPFLKSHPSESIGRWIIPIKEIDGRVQVAIAAEKQLSDGKLPVVFDLDLICEKDLKVEQVSQTETYKSIREFKNLIFMSSFTDKGLELFK